MHGVSMARYSGLVIYNIPHASWPRSRLCIPKHSHVRPGVELARRSGRGDDYFGSLEKHWDCHGVAVSSLILQNALFMYLNKMVTGKHKAEIIDQVRKSVHAVVDLDPRHQAQVGAPNAIADRVVANASQSLTHTLQLFGLPASAVVASVILLLIILPIKLPRLGKKR
jgi:hypothetical protein